MQTYRQLQEDLGLKTELPITPEWSAAADYLFIIKSHCLKIKPETIVECSSGLTTLTLARCCQMIEQGHVYSLENGEEYASQTRSNLQKFDLDDYGNVIHAPLVETSLEGNSYNWYGLNNLSVQSIDMLVIDGPPGFIQKHSRFPALPLLYDRMSDRSVVFLDDAARVEEKELVALWLEMYPNIEHEYIETERGCSVLTIIK